MVRKVISIILMFFSLCGFISPKKAQTSSTDSLPIKDTLTLSRPILARLSFWIPSERLVEFGAAYQEKIVPILKAHGLVESSEPGRTTVGYVFTRLFEVNTRSEIAEKREALEKDPAWKELLQNLGAAFGTTPPNSPIRFDFRLYAMSAGPGKSVPAGPGRKAFVEPGGMVSAGNGKGHWRTYDVTNGLAGGVVSSIFQDREGYLWFATDGGGVSRYDGQHFTTLTTADGLADNSVLSALQDRDGNFWFGTKRGVSRYANPNGRLQLTDGSNWTTFTKKDGLAGNEVLSIFQDGEGYLWFGSEGGVSRYDGQNWLTFTKEDGLAGNKISSIFQDSKGNLWFGAEAGVSRYDGQRFTTFTTANGLAHNDVQAIVEDRDGHLWFATNGNGISRYDGVTFTNLLAGISLLSAFSARDGGLWVSSWYGVALYDGRKWIAFSTQDGLAHNWVRSIYQDREGYMWFGTYFGGVSQYDGHFTTFTEADGLVRNEVQAMLQDSKGNLWFGTAGRGATMYDGRSFTLFPRESMMPGFISSMLEDRDGNFWFSGNRGVCRYDGTTFREPTFTLFNVEDGLPPTLTAPDGPASAVNAVIQDREGDFWFGTDGGGVSRYDGQIFTTFTTQDGLAHNVVQSMLLDRDGHLWFATDGGGVSRYDGVAFTTFTEADGLASDSVRSVFQDRDGYFWFGTNSSGVSRYNGRSFATFTRRDGLAGDLVASILQDNNGNLWFGTDGGVSQYDGQTFQTITRYDGLPSNTVWSILQSKTGELWFGTLSGVTRFRPPASLTLPVFIDAVVGARRYDRVTEAMVSSNVKLVAFEFHGMSLKTRPEAMVYRYQLKGYDEDWKTTNDRRVEYTNLPRGNYTFELQVVDRDLNYSQPASVTLQIVLPWYKNGWIATPLFGALLLLLVVSMVSSVRVIYQRRRIAEQERQMLEQERQARETLEAKNIQLEEANEQIQTLNEQLQDENVRLAAELEITERIQRMILPSADELKSIADLDIAGYMEPADDVGGDYYDVLQREGMVAISIGDVTGHGLESGLVMLMTQTAVQALLHSGETDPVRFLDTLNRTIYNNVQRMASDKNLTLCLLDYRSGELKLSGQHEEMIVARLDGTVELIDTIDLGFPIGLDDDIADFIDQTTVQLQSGDGVVLYTDGITEAENESQEQYGLERLCEVVSQHWSQSAEDIKAVVIAEVRSFIGEQEVYDDLTLVVLKQK